MHTLGQKFRILFLRYLLVCLVACVLSSLFSVILIDVLRTQIVYNTTIMISMGALFGGVGVYLFINPWFALYRAGSNERFTGAYFALIGMAVAGPAIFFSFFLHSLWGTVCPLQQIGQVAGRPNAKFYSVADYYPWRAATTGLQITDSSGMGNSDLTFNQYIAVPVYNSAADTTGAPAAWLGYCYSFSPESWLDTAEKARLGQHFMDSVAEQFVQLPLPAFSYLLREENTETHERLLETICDSTTDEVADAVILMPQHTPFDERWLGDFADFILMSFFCAFVALLLLLIPPVDTGHIPDSW